jgi:hypothetical protein
MSNDRGAAPRGFVLGPNEATMGLLAAAILLVGAVLWCSHGPNVEKTDFSLTYVGARIVHQGLGSKLYDINFQKQVRDSLFEHPNPLFFEHPPFEALVLSPLAALPFRTAYMLWGLFNAAVWFTFMFFLRSYLPWPREDLAYICLWFLFAPVGVALFQGQSSILLLAFYAMTFIALRQKKQFGAGIWLGLGLFKLQFVLPFAFIFLLRGRWRFLGGFASSSLLLGILSLAAVGWRGVVDYVHLLSDVSNNPQNLSYGSAVDMPTIYGFVHALLGKVIGHTGLNLFVPALSLALLVLIAWQRLSKFEGKADDLMFASAIAASLVTGSHMFTHDFSPMLLALFLAGANFPPRPHRGLRFALAATMVLFWSFPIYFLFVAWHCLYLLCPVLLLFAISALFASRQVAEQTPNKIQFVGAG